LETLTQLAVIYFIKNKHQPLIAAQILRKLFSCLSGQTYSSWGVIHHNDTAILFCDSTLFTDGNGKSTAEALKLM